MAKYQPIVDRDATEAALWVASPLLCTPAASKLACSCGRHGERMARTPSEDPLSTFSIHIVNSFIIITVDAATIVLCCLLGCHGY